MSSPFIVVVADAPAMQAVGERLGRILEAGDVVGLIGPLGAGKTTFVQGVARGTGVPGDRHVASPTFTLVNEHPGRVPLVHVDFYRIQDAREVPELGLGDAFDRAAVAIEWLDRFPDAAPGERLEIEIAFTDAGSRRLTLTPRGLRAEVLAAALGELGAT